MTRALILLAFASLVWIGCSPVNAFCQAQGDCDDFAAQFPLGFDQVGGSDDSVNVCVADNSGFLNELRANKEKACADVADAWETFMACAADVYAKDSGDACKPFTFGNANPCDSELQDFIDAQRSAGNNCDPDET